MTPGQCAWGIDVSYAQSASAVDWQEAARQGARYGIVRLTNGVDADTMAQAHCQAIRNAGLTLGAYAFFIPWRDPLAMVRALESQSYRCGYGYPGDLYPWIDCESWQGASGYHKASPEWAPVLRDTMALAKSRFGGACLYINLSDWVAMGSPDWIGEYPLACAHYTKAEKPLTAGGLDCAYWQNAVEPIPGVSSRPIDHSFARLPLLTIPHPESEHVAVQPQRVDVGHIAVEFDHAEHSRIRNLAIANETESGKHG